MSPEQAMWIWVIIITGGGIIVPGAVLIVKHRLPWFRRYRPKRPRKQ